MLPATAVTTPSATASTPLSATPTPNGNRAIAMNTATPAAMPVAPLSCSPAIATPAAPIAAITAVWNATLRSGKLSLIATASVTLNTTSANVTASAEPCNPGAG